jgi:hypothetical protein
MHVPFLYVHRQKGSIRALVLGVNGQKGFIRRRFARANGQKIKKPPAQVAAGFRFLGSGTYDLSGVTWVLARYQ